MRKMETRDGENKKRIRTDSVVESPRDDPDVIVEDIEEGTHRCALRPCPYDHYEVDLKEEDLDPEFDKVLKTPGGFTFFDLVSYKLRRLTMPFILSSPTRDFLVRTDTKLKVPAKSVEGKRLGLFFYNSSSLDCYHFLRVLVDVYSELLEKGGLQMVVIPSSSEDRLDGYMSEMDWLAVPPSDTELLTHLKMLFIVTTTPVLFIIDENGQLVSDTAAEMILDYGVEAYPFTSERLDELKRIAEATKNNQCLESVFASHRFVNPSTRRIVHVSELQGKIVGLYFSENSYKFTTKLIEVYQELKARGVDFEIVMVPIEDDEEPFRREFEAVPWLSLPFMDKSRWRLHRYFEVSRTPTLVIIGPDGKTRHSNVVGAVKRYGAAAYPFTAEKLKLLKLEKARALRNLKSSLHEEKLVIAPAQK